MSKYALMGLTGRVGGVAAETLLSAGHEVRGIVRDPAKAGKWAARGVELAVARFEDAAALEKAFTGVEGVFVMVPPVFAPDADFSESRRVIDAVSRALEAARPDRVVALSSVGSQHDRGLGLITQTHLLEEALTALPVNVGLVRPAWFLENAEWDVPLAKEAGVTYAFLAPDHAIPMVGTADIGRTVAELLREEWSGRRVVELEGPREYSPHDIATVLAKLLNREVRAQAVPREQWESLFEAQGMPAGRTGARIEMLEGFESGWIDFEGAERRTGTVTLEEVLRKVV